MIAAFPTAPSYIQRAAIIALLSFVFFLAMLVAFLFRQQSGYLILAAAFFVLNLFTLAGFLMQRRNVASLFENGIKYKALTAYWNEIVSIDDGNEGITIVKADGSAIKIPRSVDDLGRLNFLLREKTRL
ncbi:MAG: hypothetical protein ACJ72Z_14700 [Pyrinomonadaceae bacterium]